MKKKLLFAMALIMVSGFISAQGFYAKIGFGGAIGICPDYDHLANWTTNADGTFTWESVPFTMGSGFYVKAGAGYMIKKHVGIELVVGEFLGLSVKETSKSEMAGAWDRATRYYGRMFEIIPAIIITPGLEKVNPYARIGIIIGAYPQMYRKSTGTRSSATDYSEMETEYYHGGVALGIMAAAGVDFNISNLIALNLELNWDGVSYSPKQSELTAYEIDGQDRLGDLTTREKKIKYVKILTVDPLGNPDQNSPTEQLRSSYPFSNVGLSFGLKFRFGK